MMLCVNRCLLICLSLLDACYKAVEPLDTNKEQGVCPQMNTDKHGYSVLGYSVLVRNQSGSRLQINSNSGYDLLWYR